MTPTGRHVTAKALWPNHRMVVAGRNKLIGFNFATNTPKRIAEYDTVRQPDTVAVAPGSHTLWVTGSHDGVVQQITR